MPPHLPAADVAYSQLGPSASEVGGPTGVLALRDIKAEPQPKGSLVSTIQWQGSGGWVQTPAGRQWLSLKHAGSKVIDIKRVCFAACLPPGMDPAPYCTGREKCKHAIPGGYSQISSFDRALRDDELITKRDREEGGAPSKSSRGRGGDRRRDNGRGGGWSDKNAWGSKGGRGQKGDWQQQQWQQQHGGDWNAWQQQPKPDWNAWNDWQGKGGYTGKGDWGSKGSWGGKGEWNGGARNEWAPAEKGKGKGKGKGEGPWGRGWGN